MFGHGCPHCAPKTRDRFVRRHENAFSRLLPVCVFLCALVVTLHPTFGQETNLRLRFAWGGGQARQWHATITVDNGTFSDAKPLALDPDVPGSIDVRDNEVRVHALSPRDYDGVDLRVDASLEATLVVELIPADAPHDRRREEIVLSQIIKDPHSVEIDDRKNFLLIRRSPGDRLRINFRRDSLVFAPGDRFPVSVVPHHPSLPPGATLRGNIQLLRGRTEAEVWSKAVEVKVDANGNAAPIGPLDVEIPMQEGVYDLRVTLTKAARLLTPFARGETVLQRKIQLVVIDPKLVEGDAGKWREFRAFDPANPAWWERLKKWQLPQLKLFGDGPIGIGADTFWHNDQRLTTLAPNGWQAYPLPVEVNGRPHVLEVDYPSDLPQTLGISIVEPNAAGQVTPIGLDSGVHVPVPDEGHPREPTMRRHRLVFWPRSSSPILLMNNQHGSRNAVFGKVRVYSGPVTLPPSDAARKPFDGRMVATYFDKPLFTENFSASEGLDHASGTSRKDWGTFYMGGQRLTEYLNYVGYNAAFVSVMCEGSTIYPSRLVQPTPKYDQGTFFTTGQDPLRKDVLEMLLTMFDRKGIKFIPTLRFSSPLPALERERRNPAKAPGLELVNDQGIVWLEQQHTHQGLAPYYNPLDDRVQTAMVDVVAELVHRYGHHKSFAGIALQLGPYTFAQLPGEGWGFDDRTVAQFTKDSGVAIPKPPRDVSRFAMRDQFLRSTKGARNQWLQWRSNRLALLYSKMVKTVQRRQPNAKLYLVTADSLTSLEMQTKLRPTLPHRGPVGESPLMSIGIDQRLYKGSNVVLFRPARHSPATPFSEQAVNIHLDHSHQFDRLFDGGKHAGSFHFHVPRTTSLPSFERLSPFGRDRTQMWLVPHIATSGEQNRRRLAHNLARFDTQTFVEGGWMSVMGQEDTLKDAIEVVRRLPDERFHNVTPADDATPRQGIVVRTLPRRDQTYFYVVNDSPWLATVDLDLATPTPVRMQSLNSRDAGKFDGRAAEWQIQLEPYDVIGATFSAPDTTVKDWHVTIPKTVQPHLERVLADIDLRFKELAQPKPRDVLRNPGFEAQGDDPASIDWLYARGDNVAVVPDGERRTGSTGKRSLRISVLRPDNVAWLRSQPFDVPKTGRITVLAWLRIDDPNRQPTLRLAIEGQYHGEVYYRFRTVGGRSMHPLDLRWKQYRFYVDNLPQSGLTGLRVGFDLMDRSTVYVDDVEVYDSWFGRAERRELQSILAPARLQLSRGHAVQFQRFMESYWGRFLLEHVPVAANPRVARDPQIGVHRAPKPDEAKAESKGNFFKKFIFGG